MTGHQYGPHDPANDPQVIPECLLPGKGGRRADVAVPPAIRAQRQQLNTLAHEAAR